MKKQLSRYGGIMPPRSTLSTSESRLLGRCIRYGTRLTSRVKRLKNATAARNAQDIALTVTGGEENEN